MLDILNVQKDIVLSCAPCFAGVKPSNLVAVSCKDFKRIPLYKKLLEKKGFSLKVLCRCKTKAQILLYNKNSMQKLLSDKEVLSALDFFGYEKFLTPEKMLHCLSKKMCKAQNSCTCKNSRLFPHEIGIFLGYPVYDVLEYCKNDGKGYLVAGYWKVYSNAENAIKIFNLYTECKKRFALQIEKGLGLNDLLSA
ncbi:MAG: DUF3793 family protein [Treponemataceae bacterium]